MAHSQLLREIEQLGPWFHNLHLPGDIQTCPSHALGDFPSFKWQAIAPELPADLSGWTALDIGCNAGFYSFELAQRGATVTAIDIDEHYLTQARWAAHKFGLQDRIDFQRRQVYDLARCEQRYDLVLFMGVLYHLRYPLLALDCVSRLATKLLIFQCMSVPGDEPPAEVPIDLPLEERAKMAEPGWPKLAFIEYHVAGDGTNWWVPNHACIEAMLRSTGLEVRSRPAHEIYLCVPDRDSPNSMWSWNEAEFLAASGQSRGT